jgi:hypothetical protein
VFFIKVGDVLPRLRATLYGTDGAPIDLTLASAVTLRVRQTGSATPVKFAKPCTVTGAKTGEIEYPWATGDTATAGTYEAEFCVTWQDGTTQTVPNNGNAVLKILPNLT